MAAELPVWFGITSSVATVAIAAAVYGIQSQKLWLDFVDRRLKAFEGLSSSQSAYIYALSNIAGESDAERSKRHELHLALVMSQRTAISLFGPEFRQTVEQLDKHLRSLEHARRATRYGSDEDKRPAFGACDAATTEIDRLTLQLHDDAKPYLAVGSRGLSLSAKAVLLGRMLRRRIRK